ncbi:MAG: hypothetical protein JWM20_158 [Patescibacteria group bacterium]|nr:hypothetical protein [Patescibacteria group bacterium]
MTKPMTLKELLEHMYELALGGFADSQAFYDTFKEYDKRFSTRGIDGIERQAAYDYLNGKEVRLHGIGDLNIQNVISMYETPQLAVYPSEAELAESSD